MNGIRHFEFAASDPEKLGKFYSDLFGWHSEMFAEMGPYAAIDTHAGAGINGGAGPAQEGNTGFTVYAQVDDIQAKLDKALELGATMIMPVTEVPKVVTFAIFADPQGNAFGLVKNDSEMENGVSPGDNPPVTWFEILGANPKALRDFYSKLLNWKFQENAASEQTGEYEYYEVEHDDDEIGGAIGSTMDGNPHVIAYTQVDDLQKWLDKAGELGGKTVVPPTDVADSVAFAQFSDPDGIVFGLWKSLK